MPSARSRAACSGCRNRKQKCDEKKPICSRCRRLGRPCEWPVIQKRGPTKGYTEALEHRLEATEHALLRLLSVTNESLKSTAFNESSWLHRFESETHSAFSCAESDGLTKSRPAEDKAVLMERWDEFPLRDAEEIRRWAQNYRMQSNHLSSTVPDSATETDREDDNPYHEASIPVYPITRTHDATLDERTVHPPPIQERSRGDHEDSPLVRQNRDVANSSGMSESISGPGRTSPTAVEPTRSKTVPSHISDVPQQFRERFLW